MFDHLEVTPFSISTRLGTDPLITKGSSVSLTLAQREHCILNGVAAQLTAEIEHHDSPDLHHWPAKQNRYTTAEAIASYQVSELSATPKLFGSSWERRMWLKRHLFRLPCRYSLLILYNYVWLRAWRSG